MKWILVVDDEPHVTRLMRTHLEKQGFGVEVAPNGEVALDKLAHRSFDAMVTDLTMPRMNGVELCEEVRKSSRNQDLFIFIVTSRAEHDLREWAEGIERLEFMEKPVSLIDLVRRLGNALGMADSGDGET